MRIVDVHVHSASGDHDAAEVARHLDGMRREGLEALVLIMSPTLGRTRQEIADMYPPEGQPVSQASHAFELSFGQDVIDRLEEPSLVRPFLGVQTYLPALMAGGDLDDCMALVDAELRVPLAGLKVHYFGPEVGPGLLERMQPGSAPWDQDRFDQFVHDYVGIAAARGLPVVVHVDLREARRGFVDLIRAHPSVRACLCHLGYSRRLCAEVLAELPGLATDISGIELHKSMWERLVAYRDFITAHTDRVLFGSDQYIGAPGPLRASWELVTALGLDADVEDRLRWRNAAWLFGIEAEGGPSSTPGSG